MRDVKQELDAGGVVHLHGLNKVNNSSDCSYVVPEQEHFY